MEDSSNGRVTLAVLGERVDGLREDIRQLSEKFDHHCETHERLTARISELEGEQKAANTRTGVLAGINAALTAIAVGLSNVFGK